MNAPAHATNPPSLRGHQKELRGVIEDAIAMSFPLYTYKELKRLVRCEYHGFVSGLREDRTWDEISSLTGMSRAGLNKLGDEVPPTPHHNALRMLSLTLQQAGSEGMPIGQLAAAYYEQDPECSGPGLRESLHSLMRAGMVDRQDNRYRLVKFAPVITPTFAESLSRSVREIAIRATPKGESRAHRATFKVVDDEQAIKRVHDKLVQAVITVIQEAEAEAEEANSTRNMTVVLAGSPNAH